MSKRSPRYQFTDKTEHDLVGIIDYTVQEWWAAQANTYLDGLETRAQLLAENPDLGTVRETISRGLLSFHYESHIVVVNCFRTLCCHRSPRYGILRP